MPPQYGNVRSVITRRLAIILEINAEISTRGWSRIPPRRQKAASSPFLSTNKVKRLRDKILHKDI